MLHNSAHRGVQNQPPGRDAFLPSPEPVCRARSDIRFPTERERWPEPEFQVPADSCRPVFFVEGFFLLRISPVTFYRRSEIALQAGAHRKRERLELRRPHLGMKIHYEA